MHDILCNMHTFYYQNILVLKYSSTPLRYAGTSALEYGTEHRDESWFDSFIRRRLCRWELTGASAVR